MEKKRNSTTADRLRIALMESGLKQVDLVRMTGLDKGAISNYMAGRYEPKQNAINKLAIALNVSEMWLWGYDVPKARTEEQRRNDDLQKVVAQLRDDPEFYDVVKMLAELPPEQYVSVKQLLAAIVHK